MAADIFLYLMLLLAVASGWVLARWQFRDSPRKYRNWPVLFENQKLTAHVTTDLPDYALDAFISALDVNSDTLETHFTLGALHRRRGELERAIRIHENLIRRDGLSDKQISQARFELALDYSKAGLMDRAEEHLQELVEKSGSHRIPALYLLIDLYQIEREWLKASYAAKELSGHIDKQEQELIAHRCSHFYCEQAEVALSNKDYLTAHRFIRQAKQVSSPNRRPQLLMASLEFMLDHPERAREILENHIHDSAEPMAGALTLLEEVCTATGHKEEFLGVLEAAYRRTGSGHILVLLAKKLGEMGQQGRLVQLFEERRPKGIGNMPVRLVSGLDERLVAHVDISMVGSPHEDIGMPEFYQCHHCGYEAREYHWQCPSCRRWETLRSRFHLNLNG